MALGQPRFSLVSLAAVVSICSAVPVRAIDPPHWIGAIETIDCTSNCHIAHSALGGGLNPTTGNSNLCQSCHSSNALPIASADRAVPGAGGTSHGFDVNPVNATYGTQSPNHAEMSVRLLEGNVACSTCHNQHDSLPDTATVDTGGTPRISQPVKVVDVGGSGTLASAGTYSGTAGLWYLVDVTAAGSQTSALFRYSKDNGISWTPSDCTPVATATCLTASNSPAVALDSGVEISFSGGGGSAFRLGERWEFSAAFPFLRAPLDEGDINAVNKYCRDCHRAWVMTHDADLVAGGGTQTWDGNFKSHPVGVALNANGGSYDRTEPLDGDGQLQNAPGSPDVDGNASNDLRLDALGNVQCLSCHGVHYADSNTLSPDGP